MWNIQIIFVLIFINCSLSFCDINKNAKVDEASKENSTISYIKYDNNGLFTAQAQNFSKYYVEPLNAVNQCGGVFRNLQNLIEAPKSSSSRPICNLRCEYQIVSPYICENEFHVQFLDFEIDSSPNCEKDRVILNYSEVVCGKIIGVKKIRTQNGVLNITFLSKKWDVKEGNGFRLLITRLPCLVNSKEDQTEIDSLEPSAPEIVDNEDRCFQLNSSISVHPPFYRDNPPIYGIPLNKNYSIRGRQDIPVIPLPTPPFYPPTPPPFYSTEQPILPPFIPPFYPQPPPVGPGGIFPPQFLPQCCRNSYNQNRFILISQGFPSLFVKNNDCLFVIHRSSPNVCRLKIIFKYFLLEDSRQFGCINNFVEIDGQRICGCKTNFVYETLWGSEPKIIRMRTISGQFVNPQGFVLDIVQEACPFKIQQSQQNRGKRFIFHNLFLRNQQSDEFASAIEQIKTDVDEKFKSKFFQADRNSINSVCVMNHLRMFQMKLELIGIPKQYCIPKFY